MSGPLQDRLAPFRADLEAIAAGGRTRRLIPRAGVDFASNDYIGLAGSLRLANSVRRALEEGVPVGAAGSRLLRGNTEWHEGFEDAAARFFGSESALMLGGGYQANVAVLSTLPQRGDLLLMDELSHASSREGARLTRAAVAEFRHNDPGHAADVIRAWRAKGGAGAAWICAESLYSMDGDRAPLDELAALADTEGFLVVDEAHATGAWGPDGRGLSHALEGRGNVVTLHTLGKGLGGSGAVLTLPRVLRDFIVNRGRPFIFATAPSPLMAVAATEALAILRDEPERRTRLRGLIDLFTAEMARRLPHLPPSGSQIVPLVVGDEDPTMRLARRLQDEGLDVRGIRPPTVPAGTCRLRVSLTLNVSPADVLRLAEVLEDAWPVS